MGQLKLTFQERQQLLKDLNVRIEEIAGAPHFDVAIDVAHYLMDGGELSLIVRRGKKLYIYFKK